MEWAVVIALVALVGSLCMVVHEASLSHHK